MMYKFSVCLKIKAPLRSVKVSSDTSYRDSQGLPREELYPG